MLLRRDEIVEVREVGETGRGPQRCVLGGTYFDVATNRPERFWSSRILVAAPFVDADLETVRAELVAALR